MPRFIARPITVEAHQFTGDVALWPDPFRLVVRRHGDGRTEILTLDGARPVRYGDFVMHGPGGFSVVHEAEFEASFDPAPLVTPVDEGEEPADPPVVVTADTEPAAPISKSGAKAKSLKS